MDTKAALLISDMQRDLVYLKKRWKVASPIIQPILSLKKHCIERNIPIFYLNFCLPPDDDQFTRFDEVYCVKGTRGADLIDELLPPNGTIIERTKHSAFFGTNLDELLHHEKINTLIITGIQAQICILTTAADAHFRGYKVIVPEDCIASTRVSNKQWAVKWIKKYVGEISTSKNILENQP